MNFSGFDWDLGNVIKCGRHGLTIREIEDLFDGEIGVVEDIAHSGGEFRFWAIGKVRGRYALVVFTFRSSIDGRLIRPISARYMHQSEVLRVKAQNPDLP